MSQGPRRLIEDPEWGGAFEGLLEEHGRIERLPDDIRADVAAMVAASVAGAVGVAVVGAAASSMASTGGAVATASSGGVAVASATAGSVGAASTAAASGVALGSGVAVSSGVAGAGLASSVGVATAMGSLGAASASLAALGIVPKVILGLSLAGAVTVGGVAAVENAPTRSTELEAATVIVPAGAEVEKDRVAGGALGKRKKEAALRDSVEKPASKVSADVRDAEQETEPFAKSVEEGPPSGPRPAVVTGLAGEVNLLQRARAALSVNREYAWTLLNEYHRRYPQGSLRSEYEVLVRRVQTVPNDAPQAKAAEPGTAKTP